MEQNDTNIYPKMRLYEEFDGEVFVVDNLIDLSSGLLPAKSGYNLFLLCNSGRVQLEMVNSTITFSAGQMCILPSNKMMSKTLVSPGVNVSLLCVSDKALKSILGAQISIWNKALYLQKTHVIDASWCHTLKDYIFTVFKEKRSPLFKEIALSFLRTFLLFICEQFGLADEEEGEPAEANKPGILRQDMLFSRFLELLSSQSVKRHPVSFYAAKLCVTPKYLAGLSTRVSGKSPVKWIMEYTMEDIYTQLRMTDKSLKEIAMQTGFPNTSFFGKFFREKSGMTPQEYRQQVHRN